VPGVPDPEYVLARRVLLDAIQVLGEQRSTVVLVGAQAIYVHTELLGLEWDDIDPSGATATLHVMLTLSQTRTGHIFEKPKNGKGRSIKCSQRATEALGRHRSR
jgi:integrase